jgi:hypothetical protein
MYQIDDMPGYAWELNWTAPDGEVTSIECTDLNDVFEAIKGAMAEYQSGGSTRGEPG